MRLDGYIRVSKVRGREGPSFISPIVQREEIEAYAHYKGAEIVEFHTDLDESGAKVDRPGLARALDRVEQGLIDGIIVAKLDRFARSLGGALETIKRLDEAGAVLVSVAEGLDPTTPAGKMMMRMMLVIAEFELDRVRETWDESRRRAVARGLHLAGASPTGYRRGRAGRLELDPCAAPHLAQCFRMRAECRSWTEILGYVAEAGLSNPFGKAKWTIPSLLAVMANRVYLGEARSGAYVNRTAHEPLIDRGTWELAQMTQTLTALRSARPSLLAGLIRCAGCRYVMGPGGEAAKRAGHPRRYYCKGHAPGGCPLVCSIPGGEVEDFVQERFFTTYEGSSLCLAAGAGSRAQAEVALREAEGRLEAAQLGVTAEGAPVGEELDGARAAVEAARELVIELTRSTLMPPPAQLRAAWPQMEVTERRRHIAMLIDAVVVREDRGRGLDDRVLIMSFGTRPSELPARGKAVRLAPIKWAA